MSNYKCLSLTDFNNSIKELPTFLPQVGFRLLSSVTPSDLPIGSVVVLFNIYTFRFETVVVKEIDKNRILHFLHQTGRFHDTWYQSILEDTAYDNYLFKVIS